MALKHCLMQRSVAIVVLAVFSVMLFSSSANAEELTSSQASKLIDQYNRKMAIALQRSRTENDLEYAYNLALLGDVLSNKASGKEYSLSKARKHLVKAQSICQKVAPNSDEYQQVTRMLLDFYLRNGMPDKGMSVAGDFSRWIMSRIEEQARSYQDAEKIRALFMPDLMRLIEIYAKSYLGAKQQEQFFDMVLIKKYLDRICPLSAGQSLPTFKDVWQRLPGECSLVEFVEYRSSDTLAYAATVISKDKKSPYKIQLTLSEQMRRLAIDNKRIVCTTHEYYDNVWLPITQLISLYNTVYFVPDGELHGILLERMKEPTDKRHYVCDSYEMHRLSTSLDISKPLKLKNSRTQHLRMLGYVDYGAGTAWQRLLGTAMELNDIYEEAQKAGVSDVGAWRGTDVTEERLRGFQNEHVTILHIATHGYCLMAADSTQYCGLLLANANAAWDSFDGVGTANDGIVTSEEMARMYFDNLQLVVLSACGTGIGVDAEGKPLMLSALREAGASNVILSHWSVNDEATRVLMREFYHNYLKEGMNMSRALKKAQDVVRKGTFEYPNRPTVRGNGADPYFWASFVLYE